MYKIGTIGDPHVKINSLHEVEAIINFAIEKFDDCDEIVILGDLFDTHSVLRLELQHFWQRMVTKILTEWKKRPEQKLILIEGNHDRPHAKQLQHISALDTLHGDFIVVKDVYTNLTQKVTYLGYQHHEEDFLEKAELGHEMGGTNFLICHQTFNGAKFDNGMYAPDGFDSEKVPQRTIISGHIHSRHDFGKVCYFGTARWDSKSDANKEKGITKVIIDGDTWGTDFFSTEGIVPKMFEIEWKEGEDAPVFTAGNKYVVKMVGNSTWISKNRTKILDKAKITPVYTDKQERREARKKEFTSIETFIQENFTSQEVGTEALIDFIKKI